MMSDLRASNNPVYNPNPDLTAGAIALRRFAPDEQLAHCIDLTPSFSLATNLVRSYASLVTE